MAQHDFDPTRMRVYLAGITNDTSLARRLAIVQAQIKVAFTRRNDDALVTLQTHEKLIIERRAELLDL